MRFVNAGERRVLLAVAALADGNPFLPERVSSERQALGRRFSGASRVWHADVDLPRLHPNLDQLRELVEQLAPTLRDRLARGAEAGEAELLAYEGLVRHHLYQRYESEWFALVLRAAAGKPTTGKVAAFARFARDVRHFLALPGVRFPFDVDASHLFAWGFQIRRAFHHTFRQIHGGSMPAARLRAEAWQSIFTHDVQRYRRGMYQRMADVPTLVIGESGTGKELVARAIGLSRYVPFDAERQAFADEYARSFHPVNLSALSPTLIESELFGHRRGAFTGAVEDRGGWLEACGSHGTVFLDEVGELDPAIQVKLLRVLQARSFQRIGETAERSFQGKIVAATNRDLYEEMRAGRVRTDFYYRLCADVVRTPTLREQLAGDPEELHRLVGVLARRIAGEAEAEALAAEVIAWIESALGVDYAWPGNVRELEQCVRNVLVRGTYHPPGGEAPGAGNALDGALADARLTADELLRRYCTHAYFRLRSYEQAARALELDRRTVKAKVDDALLAALRGEA